MVIAEIKAGGAEYEVTLFGVTYHLLTSREISLRDHYLMGNAQVRLLELRRVMAQEEPQADAAAGQRDLFTAAIAAATDELEKLLDVCLRPIMVRVPAEVYAKLSPADRQQIMEAYQVAMYRERELEKEKEGEHPFAGGSPS